jgi:hypothetical protein
MFTKANWYYAWNSRKRIPFGDLLTWLGITIAAIILGISDGIQGLNEINQLLIKSSNPAQSISSNPAQATLLSQQSDLSADKNTAKNTAWLVVFIIVFPSLIGSVVKYLTHSKDQKKSSEISKKYLHPNLQKELESLYDVIVNNHQLQGDFRVYIAIPYSKKLLSWEYKICFSHIRNPIDRDISIKVCEGELGYLIHNLQSLQSQKYVPQALALNPNCPLGYKQVSQHSKNMIDQIFVVKNSAIMGLFDGSFLCGALVVTTSDVTNLNLLEDQSFKTTLTAFVRRNEELITTIWETTGGIN